MNNLQQEERMGNATLLVRVMFTIVVVLAIVSFPVEVNSQVDQSCEEFVAFDPSSSYKSPRDFSRQYADKYGFASSILLENLRLYTTIQGGRKEINGVAYEIYLEHQVIYGVLFSFIGRAYCIIEDQGCQKCLDKAHVFFDQCNDGKIHPSGHSYLPNCGMSFFLARAQPQLPDDDVDKDHVKVAAATHEKDDVDKDYVIVLKDDIPSAAIKPVEDDDNDEDFIEITKEDYNGYS